MIGEAGVEYTPELESMLVKILNQVSIEDSRQLSDYVLLNMDKKSLKYLDICALKNETADSDEGKLSLAIELDLQT